MGIRLPVEDTVNNRRIFYGECYKEGYDVVLACNDVLEFLKDVPKNSVTLVVTSPPYNIGKAYE
jgi:hypothetical protein